MPFVPKMVSAMLSGYSWLLVLGAFMGVSFLAEKWASSDASEGKQYAGLGLYIVAEAVIFIPILHIAKNYSSPDVIANAGIITLLLFLGLTFIAFTTKKDFSFLGGMLKMSFFIIIGIIISSFLFGFSLGLFFSAIMVIIASASILYQTSNILRKYNTNQHVAASLALFSAVALLYWYILQILMSRD